MTQCLQIAEEPRNVLLFRRLSAEYRVNLRIKLLPDNVLKGGKAIHRYGFTGQVAGLVLRPQMMRQEETVLAVRNYIRFSPNKKKLRQPVSKIGTFTDIILPEVTEPSAAKCYNNYKMIYKRRSLE